MKTNIGRLFGGNFLRHAILILLLQSALLLPGQSAYSQNLIQNPGFESGTTPWSFYTNGSGSFSSVAPGFTGSFSGRVSISVQGTNVQLSQSGFLLEANTSYTLTFNAYSNTGHGLSLSVLKNNSPYTNYGLSNSVVNLSASWQKYTVQFTTTGFSGTTTDTRFRFWFAPYDAAGDAYFVDNVSLAKTVSAPTAPLITSHPTDQTVNEGQSATFNVGASGTPPLTYKWQRNGVDIPGATATSYATPPASLADSGAAFRCIVSNQSGSDTSNNAQLSVNPAPPSFSLLQNPDFESGTAPWTFYTNGSGNFMSAAPGFTGSSSGRVSISAQGTNVQLSQSGFILEANITYSLTFNAYSNTGHDLALSVLKNNSPYTGYGLSNRVINLTTSWQTYTVQFTATGFSGTTTDTRFRFWFAPYDVAGDIYFIDNVTLKKAVAPPLSIDVWYGNQQSFGTPGDPTPYINIPGNVSPADGVSSLKYSLSGGAFQSLSLGPDLRRLQAPGDFNIDILHSALLNGPNQVIIRATNGAGTNFYDTVQVNYSAGNTWPSSYAVNWSSASSIQSVAKVLDGLWSINQGSSVIRPVQLGYDRLVAIGEETWTNYEVTAPITIHRIDSAGYAPPSNGAAIGFILRWPGHTDNPPSTAGRQPKSGYLPLGAFPCYTYNTTGEKLKLIGNDLQTLSEDNSGRVLQMGTRYFFKARVETVPGVGPRYLFKVWQDNIPEPGFWDLTGQDSFSDPQQGCLLIVAHHVDASIGNITVNQMAVATPPLSTIDATPAKDIVDNLEGIPSAFTLLPAYPNPFNPSTTIRFGLPVESHVSIDVYNVLGQQVTQLVGEVMIAGFHDVVFDATGLSSGVYFCRMNATAAGRIPYIQSQKLMLNK